MSDKIYINGCFLREVTFDNGGKMIKLDITNVSEFADQLIKHAKETGKITIDIKQRQEITDTGISHYLQVSQFVPQQQQNKAGEGARSANANTQTRKTVSADDVNPFL